jgi:alpha-mannosidase
LAQTVEAQSQALLDGLAGTGAATPFNPAGFARDEIVMAPDGSLQRAIAPAFGAGRAATPGGTVHIEETGDGVVLDNGVLRAALNGKGHVTSLRIGEREVLSGPANRFVLFDDRPTFWDAWDIDPFALETGEECAGADGMQILLQGGPRAELRFTHTIGGKSRIVQTVRLDAGSATLEFDTEIDWQERKRLLKVAFPFAVASPRATYETMYGAVERPTHANTDADLAQYEVPGHRWADLSEPGYGVSLLTDSRYGYSTLGGTMTLSLLRGTEWPDRTADLGTHKLRYALYPHDGDWRAAGTVREALLFNRPVLWATGVLDIAPLVTAEPANVVIDTIKPAEDGKGVVVRLYESCGMACEARLSFDRPTRRVRLSNTLEDGGATVEGGRLKLRPYQIATLRIE